MPFPKGWTFFMYLFSICQSSSVKCSFMSFTHFLIRLLVLLLTFELFFKVPRYESFIRYEVCKYFLQSVTCLFIFFTWSSTEKKFLILMKSNCPIFLIYGITSKNSLLSPRSQRFRLSPMSCAECFIFKYMFHF